LIPLFIKWQVSSPKKYTFGVSWNIHTCDKNAMQWRKCREIALDNINLKKTKHKQENSCAV
jgi:hypothetical protein